MKKTNLHSWEIQRKPMKRIFLAIILALIVFLSVGCKGRHWGGGHDHDGYDRNGGHGCISQFVESIDDDTMET